MPRVDRDLIFGAVLWLVISAALALGLYAGCSASAGTRALSQADCRVMEEYLRGQGHRVQITSGCLVEADGEMEAVLNCRAPAREAWAGLEFIWVYPLGRLDERPALEWRGGDDK
jgi:hypothetical protein